MALDNFRDLSPPTTAVNAGFLFEFYCEHCGKKWQSDFKPYRLGQITGFLQRFAFLGGGNMVSASRVTSGATDYSARNKRDAALEVARKQAETRYVKCDTCHDTVCKSCFDDDHDECAQCVDREAVAAKTSEPIRATGAASCPNCRTASSGGRFCSECGYDMASTHKSCPGCGAMADRQARFCGDCGHGF